MVSLGSFGEQPLGTVLSGLIPAGLREYRPSIVFCGCSFTLVCSLVLGGGTRGGLLSDAILELLAIPALLLALTLLIELPVWKTKNRTDAYWALAFCLAMALVPLIQLVPLPPWLWTMLPGREELVAVNNLLGGPLPWLPMSVSPNSTWLSFLSLLPPMAIFLAAIQLSYRERRWLSLVIVALGVVSVFIGLAQVAEGPESPLRFYSFTNNNEAVGFFANRNHFAAFLYGVLLFAAAWMIDIGFKIVSWKDFRSIEHFTVVAVTAIFMVFIVVIVGEAVARSRAGLVLTIVALLAIFALSCTDRRSASVARINQLVLAAIVLAIILSVQFALYRVFDRFGTDTLADARITFARNTIQAAKAFLPFGAGLGTFVPVYAIFERPIDAFANVYANHAHNDFLELWLETGGMGLILFCLFVIWLGFAALKVWWSAPANASALDWNLARVATVVIGLLMVHSLVDYPLRTEAIMAVFAVSCAFMIAPLRDAQERMRVAGQPGHDAARRQQWAPTPPIRKVPDSAVVLPAAAGGRTEVTHPRPDGGRWGEGIDWPREWQNSGEQKRSPPGSPESDVNSSPENSSPESDSNG